MHQPPGRPPNPPYRPAPTQPGVSPGGAAPPPPGYGHAPAAPGYPAAGAPSMPLPAVRKNRGGLRFLASACIFSAWATLVLSVLVAGFSFLAAAGAAAASRAAASSDRYFPSQPSPPGLPEAPGGLPGLDDLGIPGMGGGAPPGPGSMLMFFKGFLPGLYLASGLFTLVTGVVSFLLFLGMGQACYVLLDLEEQNFQINQTLLTIAARLGTGR